MIESKLFLFFSNRLIAAPAKLPFNSSAVLCVNLLRSPFDIFSCTVSGVPPELPQMVEDLVL